MSERAAAGPLVIIGFAVWLAGFIFESVGDWQLARFKADPAHRGLIMDRGLWRYTRHPNYFGDFCMWWGLFLISLGSWAGLATVFAPLLMTFILTRGTGQRLTDQRMAATRPAYSSWLRVSPGRPASTRSRGVENPISRAARRAARAVSAVAEDSTTRSAPTSTASPITSATGRSAAR